MTETTKHQVLLAVFLLVCISESASFLTPSCPLVLRGSSRRQADTISTSIPRKQLLVMKSSQSPSVSEKYRQEYVGPNLPTADSGKVFWPSVRSADFVHPFDLQATAALKRIPFVETVVREGMTGMLEEAIYLDNLSNSIRVGPKQLPHLYQSLQEAKKILGLDLPVEVYVRQNPMPNAYTMAMKSKRPFIVIHSSLIDLLTPAELQAVIAHELGHLLCEHGIWITLANIISVFASQVPGVGRAVGQTINSGILRWLRAAELSCDRASLLVAQDPRVVVSVIMKLSGGSSSFAKDLNPDDFLRQAQDFEKESSGSWIKTRMRDSLTMTLSHPLPVVRVGEIYKWSQSTAYSKLLGRGKLLN